MNKMHRDQWHHTKPTQRCKRRPSLRSLLNLASLRCPNLHSPRSMDRVTKPSPNTTRTRACSYQRSPPVHNFSNPAAYPDKVLQEILSHRTTHLLQALRHRFLNPVPRFIRPRCQHHLPLTAPLGPSIRAVLSPRITKEVALIR